MNFGNETAHFVKNSLIRGMEHILRIQMHNYAIWLW